MTDKQRQVLQDAETALREHFDGYVLTVIALDVDDDGCSETISGYGGGMHLALGLADYQRHKLRKTVWSEADEAERRAS